MRLFLLACLTMTAFAANSLLNRAAIAGGTIDVASFATIRLIAGAVTLAVLCAVLRGGLHLGGPARKTGVLALLVYLYGFSAAYDALDAGIGALILFAMVQVTMFGFAVSRQEHIPPHRWVGTGLALAGLFGLLWPGEAATISLPHAAAMALAGVAWGVYSLAGKRSADALQATAANFVLAVPVGLGVLAGWAAIDPAVPSIGSLTGVGLAILAGAITSGLGYALWYTVLPSLSSTSAAVAQLSVPVIALIAGAMLLGETVSLRAAMSAATVLLGVALSLVPARAGRSG